MSKKILHLENVSIEQIAFELVELSKDSGEYICPWQLSVAVSHLANQYHMHQYLRYDQELAMSQESINTLYTLMDLLKDKMVELKDVKK